ncbi:MAG: hypothetical protein ACTSU5_03420, partial [Promethearchaeota archaeon]
MNDDPGWQDEFLKDANRVAGTAREWFSGKKVVKCYSHVDADGISAASVLAKALKRAEVPFQVKILKQISVGAVNEIKGESDP